jgi:hypothetical protein
MMVRDENLSARESVRRVPATSVTLFRVMSVEDACDMEASSEASDRPHGPWQYCSQAPSFARPPNVLANVQTLQVVLLEPLVLHLTLGYARTFRYACILWALGRWGRRSRGGREEVEACSSMSLFALPSSASFIFQPAPFRIQPLTLGITSYFRYACFLRVRPFSSTLPASFGYSPLVHVRPVAVETNMQTCTAGNVRVTPSPVDSVQSLPSAKEANRY